MNKVTITGKVSDFKYDYTTQRGKKIYTGKISAARLSGAVDCIEFHTTKSNIENGKKYATVGEIRTLRTNNYPRKKTYVKIFEFTEVFANREDENIVEISGLIKNQLPIRMTPVTNAKLVDFSLRVAEEHSVSYPNVIGWNKIAESVERLGDNTAVYIKGRLQERMYVKDNNPVTTYEISCFKLEEILDESPFYL